MTNEQLEQWIDDLQSGMYINCVYCGHRYGPNSGPSTKKFNITMRKALEEHISSCPKHPLSAAKDEIAILKERVRELEELQYVYENTPFAHWMERTKKAEAYKSDVENAKYKAFWDDSRLADRQQWERYDWPKHQKEDSQ